MNTYLEGLVAAQRIEEARAYAARQRLIAALRPARSTLRVILGLALIKAGHWVAGKAPRRGIEAYRAGA